MPSQSYSTYGFRACTKAVESALYLLRFPLSSENFQIENMGRDDAIQELVFGRDLTAMALHGANPISNEHILHISVANRMRQSYLHPEYKIVSAWAKIQ